MSDRLVSITNVAKRWEVHPSTARSMLRACGVPTLRTEAGTEYVSEAVIDALTASVAQAEALSPNPRPAPTSRPARVSTPHPGELAQRIEDAFTDREEAGR